MTVAEIARDLEMDVVSGAALTDRQIGGVYVGDLLSWVMSHAKDDDLWITVLTNLNTVAVAVLSNVACVVIPEGIEVEEATARKAETENVIILRSKMTAYEICIKVYEKLKNQNGYDRN